MYYKRILESEIKSRIGGGDARQKDHNLTVKPNLIYIGGV